MAIRIGRQTPTAAFILPYSETDGDFAVELYGKSGNAAYEWQESLLYDILGKDEGLWVHSRFGFSVPRQNGKNEIVAMRELYGLTHGENILHTAHRTTTSGTAFRRLCKLLEKVGIKEKKGSVKAGYKAGYSKGQEFIIVDEKYGGGRIDFRTRTSTGGLGETFDLLIVDEAQEYTDDQEAALQYTIATSRNPQIIMTGTPPTPQSAGTVFAHFRRDVLAGQKKHCGWAEWSVEELTDPNDVDAWYECNPSLGLRIMERTVENEVGADATDFNVQRLGLWLKYNQRSAITAVDWNKTLVEKLPALEGQLCVGIKYGRDGENVALAVAAKTTAGLPFFEIVDCVPVRDGTSWILSFLAKIKPSLNRVVIDGAAGQAILTEALGQVGLKKYIALPTVANIIAANAQWAQKVPAGEVLRMEQPALTRVVTNCEKRAIGSQGGFGYKATIAGTEIALMDAAMLAVWALDEYKPRKAQKISY